MTTGDDEIRRILHEADERRHSEADAARRDRVEILLPLLLQLGITEVFAEYDGSGDSGQIETPVFLSGQAPPDEEEPIKRAVPVTAETSEKVLDLFYKLLEEKYAGWEINEGSYGQFEWDLATDKIQLTHNMRIESVETYEDEL
jgi:hypothetical protein